MKKVNQIKGGAIISYIAIAFNILAGILYTPWMISKIGQANYGLFTLAQSLITMFALDFGMSAAVSRFMSNYNARGDYEGANNFMGLVYKLYLAIDIVIFIVLFVLFFFINSIYQNLTPEEVETFKVLYVIVGLYTVISFPFLNLNGVLTSHEKFIPMKLCTLGNKVFTVIIMIIALLCGKGVYALVLVNAGLGILEILIKLIVIKKQTPLKVNFKFFDKGMLKDIFGFSVWTTVSSVAQRLIFNIMPTVIAAVSITGSTGVALFGLGSTVEGYVYTFATAINGLFMPRISRILVRDKKKEELEPLLHKVGRIQMLIVGFLVVAFCSFGRSFINDIWCGPDFEQSYFCAVLMIVPSLFFLPMQIANTTLVVENKVKLQAFIYIGMAVLNILLSLVLSKLYGAIGASLSIFIAYMFRTIMLGVVHHKVLKLDMLDFCKKVYLKFAPHLLGMLGVGLALEYFNPMKHGIIRFGVNAVVFSIVFFALMMICGFNDYEKDLLFGVFKKFKKNPYIKR